MLLTRSNRGMYKVPLIAAIRPIRDLGACRDKITGHNTGISLLLSVDKCVGSFKSSDRTLRD